MPDKNGRFPPVFITQVPWHGPNAAEAKQVGQTHPKQDEIRGEVKRYESDLRALARQDEAEHAAYLEWHRAGQRQARQDEAANCECEECSCADNTDDHAA